MTIFEIAMRYAEGDGLADLYKKTFPTRSHEPSKDQRALWNQAKKMYLQSENWKRLRQLKLIDAQGKCQAQMKECNIYASEIHHISYWHIGDECLWDLRAVCRSCHSKVSKFGGK
jgi:hypothetical protein